MVRRLMALVCCALVVSAAASGAEAPRARASGATTTPIARAADPERPNILLLISDDQAWSDFTPALMPSVYAQLVDQGVLFKRAYVNTSLCCPSRSQIITGLYEHHTGVDANTVPLERPTIVEALHDVGYRTMLAGKYLNSWPCTPRPEFDRWACVGTPLPSTYSMIDPLINVDGEWASYQGYQTDILADQLVSFVRVHAGGPAVLRDVLADLAAHAVRRSAVRLHDHHPAARPVVRRRHHAVTARRYTHAGRRSPSDEIANADFRYTRMAHGVRSLDDSVATILDGLGDRTRDTLVIYLSDNGFLFGEHRRFGKTDAYEGSVRVPMVIRYPATARPRAPRSRLTPWSRTWTSPRRSAAVAGFPWQADGRSLVPLLDGSAKSVRSALLIEHCRGVSNVGSVPCSGLSFVAQADAGRRLLGRGDGARQVRQLRHRRPRAVRPRDGSVRATQPDRLIRVAPPRLPTWRRSYRRSLRPALGTTIVTGPWPSGAPPSRMAAFTFFSPSRFSTYRCRLTRDGAPSTWHTCGWQAEAFGGLADGDYMFEVAGIDELGNADADAGEPQLHDRLERARPSRSVPTRPRRRSARELSFSFSSTAANASFECRLSLVGEPVSDWESLRSGVRLELLGTG